MLYRNRTMVPSDRIELYNKIIQTQGVKAILQLYYLDIALTNLFCCEPIIKSTKTTINKLSGFDIIEHPGRVLVYNCFSVIVDSTDVEGVELLRAEFLFRILPNYDIISKLEEYSQNMIKFQTKEFHSLMWKKVIPVVEM